MDVLIKPVEEGKSEVPDWGYGIIAGGGALIVTGLVVVGHIWSKKKREKQALEKARKIIAEQNEFPGGGRYTPRGNENVI